MAEKGFGVKEINLIGASGTPTIESPNNLNLNAVNVAISTNVSIGGTLSVTGNVSVGGTLTYEDVTNIDSIGIITARTGVKLPDSQSLTLGTDDDAELKHTGANLVIRNTTGNIRIEPKNGQLSIQSLPDNNTSIYFSGSKKIETTNTGAVVTGILTATTFSGSGASLTNVPAATPSDSDIQVAYTVTANGSSAYRFAGNGVVSTADNPDLYLIRGQKYRFINNSGGSHPFQIREASGGTAYSTGVTNNGAASGNIDFAPTYDSPAQLVYQCTSHGGMVGNIYLRDAAGNNSNVGVTTFADNVRLSNASKTLIVDGQILIGTTSGSEKLIIKRNDTTGPTINLENNANTAYINNWGSVGGGSGRTNRFEINAEAQAQASICAPYITFMTGGVGDSYEKIRITTAGNLKISNADKGIDFSEQTVGSVSNVTVNSEILDHYEEGTFLPFISASSSAPTVTYSGSERGGKYTRIGNIVFYSLGFQMSAYSGGSGNVYIGGFPYIGSGNPGWDGAHTFRDCSAIALNSRTNQLRAWIETSAVSGYPILWIQIHSNTTDFGASTLTASSVQAGRITVHGHYRIG